MVCCYARKGKTLLMGRFNINMTGTFDNFHQAIRIIKVLDMCLCRQVNTNK